MWREIHQKIFEKIILKVTPLESVVFTKKYYKYIHITFCLIPLGGPILQYQFKITQRKQQPRAQIFLVQRNIQRFLPKISLFLQWFFQICQLFFSFSLITVLFLFPCKLSCSETRRILFSVEFRNLNFFQYAYHYVPFRHFMHFSSDLFLPFPTIPSHNILIFPTVSSSFLGFSKFTIHFFLHYYNFSKYSSMFLHL